MITLKVYDLRAKLPKQKFHINDNSQIWENVFEGRRYDTKGKDLITYGMKTLELPFDPKVLFYIGLKRAYYPTYKIPDGLVLDGFDTTDNATRI